MNPVGLFYSQVSLTTSMLLRPMTLAFSAAIAGIALTVNALSMNVLRVTK